MRDTSLPDKIGQSTGPITSYSIHFNYQRQVCDTMTYQMIILYAYDS